MKDTMEKTQAVRLFLSDLVPVLIEALKKQQKEINQLKTKVSELEQASQAA